jgi:hypothetical protein
MRFKRHHAAGDTPVLGFIFKQGQHGLVTAMDAVEIANRQGAGAGKLGVAVTAKDFHRLIIVLIAAQAG